MIGQQLAPSLPPGARGFSLVELLIALTICALVSAGIAAVVPPARAAFERTPLEIDLQQRARTAIEAIAAAIRTSGGESVASAEFGPFTALIPPLILSDPDADRRFTRLKVIIRQPNAAQGVLAYNVAPAGPLELALDRCPNAPVVCGFLRDTTAIISDGSGRFDLFTVASVDAATRRLTTRPALSQSYPSGSFVLEAEAHTFQLEVQADGSRTLVRHTAGGAVQPLVDRVTGLWFEPYALDDAGAVAAMPVEILTDGPWLRGEPDGSYDDDLFRVRRIDVGLTLQAPAPAAGERTFRFAVFVRNTP